MLRFIDTGSVAHPTFHASACRSRPQPRRAHRRGVGRRRDGAVSCEALERRQLLAGVIISEFLASNRTGLADADGDRSDWIELFNPSAAPASLRGWTLTDDPADPAEWTFPDVSIPAGGRLVVFASDKNRTDPLQQLHTNFKLSADGEYLALFQPGGAPASVFNPFPSQPVDVSYGFVGNDYTAFRYLSRPTPGAENDATSLQYVGDTHFSIDRGFFDNPFQVAITTDSAGASIRYTTDGSAPSPTHGTPYAGPVTVSGTTVLRAMAYQEGYLPSNVDTQTYLFLDQVIRQPAHVPGWPNPTISVGGDSTRVHDYEMDPAVVDDPAYSGAIKKGLTDIPTMSLVVDQADMWDADGNGGFYRVNDVEKPVSVEIINAGHPEKNVQVDAGVEGHSDDRLKRSLRLDFRASYGDSHLTTSLLRDAPVGGDTATDTFNRLVLRGGNNRSWARISNPNQTTYTEDEWVRETQVALAGEGVHGAFVHLYINGLYWGLYNVAERPDEHFTSTYFGGDSDDWLAFNHDGIKDGDPARWNYLKGTLVNRDMSVLSNYREMEQYLDTTNFVDYLLAHFYAGVTDWPGNNFWGGNLNVPAGPTKFFAWDGEYSFGIGTSTWQSPPHAWVSPLFRKDQTTSVSPVIPKLFNAAKRSGEFKTLLADRAYRAIANGGALTDAAAQARWDALNAAVRDAVIAESARWGDTVDASRPRTRDGAWQSEVNRIRGYMTGNGAYLIAALRAEGYYPSIDPPTFGVRGGAVPPGFPVALSNPNSSGTVYYTLDGSDPRAPGGAVSASARAYAAPFALAAGAQVRTRVLRNGEWSAEDAVTFSTNDSAAPVITTQPSGRTVQPGQSTTFSVVAVGPGTLRYQWQRNGADLPGETAASYVLKAATAADNGAAYRVIVSNDHGSVTSNPATLVVTSTGVYEAEQAAWAGPVSSSAHTGFTGTGYLDYFNPSGDYVEFTVNVPSAGAYALTFRYANGSASDRPLELKVNGAVAAASVSFPATGSWVTYKTVTANANLAAGANKVRVTAIGSSGGNLDSLSVAPANPTPSDTYQAEDAAWSGAAPAHDVAGFLGSGYIDYAHSSGDYVEFTVGAGAAGSYALDFRYANGSAADRPLELSVDGQVLTGRVPFAPTGSWTTWGTSSRSVTLAAGTHKVRLTSAGSNGPNLDLLKVVPASTPPEQPVTLQAEAATLSGVLAQSNVKGYTGSGFADYQHASGDYVEWAVTAAAAGPRTITIRYANGGAADRPLALSVNGTVINPRLSFAPTGAWSTWATVTQTVSLLAGVNRLRLSAIGSGGANIDSLTVGAAT
jgi:hypothetical protein